MDGNVKYIYYLLNLMYCAVSSVINAGIMQIGINENEINVSVLIYALFIVLSAKISI